MVYCINTFFDGYINVNSCVSDYVSSAKSYSTRPISSTRAGWFDYRWIWLELIRDIYLKIDGSLIHTFSKLIENSYMLFTSDVFTLIISILRQIEHRNPWISIPMNSSYLNISIAYFDIHLNISMMYFPIKDYVF